MNECILITGGNGNIARQLAAALPNSGARRPVLVDLRPPQETVSDCVYEVGDIRDEAFMRKLLADYEPSRVYHFASLLSTSSEQDPQLAWEINVTAATRFLYACVEGGVQRFFFPSSGASYGGRGLPDPLPEDHPQWPENLYGVTKLTVERLGNYLSAKHGWDFRSLRLPLVISRFAPPAAVSAYASQAFARARSGEEFVFPVNPESSISTLYVKDVLRAIIALMDAPKSKLTRCVYNIHGFSRNALDIAESIKALVPGFRYRFEPKPEVVSMIDAWPSCHIDETSRNDWGWRPIWDLDKTAADMLASEDS